MSQVLRLEIDCRDIQQDRRPLLQPHGWNNIRSGTDQMTGSDPVDEGRKGQDVDREVTNRSEGYREVVKRSGLEAAQRLRKPVIVSSFPTLTLYFSRHLIHCPTSLGFRLHLYHQRVRRTLELRNLFRE